MPEHQYRTRQITALAATFGVDDKMAAALVGLHIEHDFARAEDSIEKLLAFELAMLFSVLCAHCMPKEF